MIFNSLGEMIKHIEREFSNKDREFNFACETYRCVSAEVIKDIVFLRFLKNSGNLALAVGIRYKGRWTQYFFLRRDHIDGLNLSKERLAEVERFNDNRKINKPAQVMPPPQFKSLADLLPEET